MANELERKSNTELTKMIADLTRDFHQIVCPHPAPARAGPPGAEPCHTAADARHARCGASRGPQNTVDREVAGATYMVGAFDLWIRRIWNSSLGPLDLGLGSALRPSDHLARAFGSTPAYS